MPETRRTTAAERSKRVAWQVRGDAAEAVVVDAPTGGAWTDHELADEAAALVREMAELRAEGIEPHLAADHPADGLDPVPEALADATGLGHRRDLLQMRRPLPVPDDHPLRSSAPAIATRAFEPGTDDEAWIRVNNRAFADHPDQGREDAATLAARTAEPWFDPAGFLVADEPTTSSGAPELAGFCWTKVHPAGPGSPDGPLGEIYVIGVDPRHRGEGLGPSFVLAGLDHLASQGIPTAVLYVDADNGPARRLYDRLGFTVHQRRRVYTHPVDDEGGR